jgi:hypothetical protein
MSTTFDTEPISHGQIPLADALETNSTFLIRQEAGTRRLPRSVLIAALSAFFETVGAYRPGNMIAEGDIPAIIVREAELAAALIGHLGEANPHPQYLTQAEGDGRYPLSTALSELIDDRVAALLVAGENITLSYNDATGQLTIASTASAGISGVTVEEVDGPPTGVISKLIFPAGTLAIAGSNATYTPANNGSGGGIGALIGGTLDSFGDSITNGYGTSAPNKAYPSLISANTGWTLTNRGVNGMEALDGADAIYAINPGENNFFTLAFGFNDLRNYQGIASGQTTFSNALKALMAWLAIPASARVKAQDAAVTYAGSWNSDTRYGTPTMGRSSSTPSSTATFNFNGSALMIGYTSLSAGTGTFTVAIDGGSPLAVVGANAAPSANNRTYGPAVAIFQGLNQTDHVCVVTVSSGIVALDWFAGLGDNLSHYSGPCCFVGNIIRMGSSAFTSPPTQTQINAYLGIYNTLIANAVRQLYRLGLRLYHVNVNNRFTIDNWFSDNIHPDDIGHEQLSEGFIDVIRQTPGLLLNGGTGGGGIDPEVPDGTPVIGYSAPGQPPFYTLLSSSSPGTFISDAATSGGADLFYGWDSGRTNFTITASFTTGALNLSSAVTFWVRAGGVNSSQGILIQLRNNRVFVYDATGTTFNQFSDEPFNTPSSGTIVIINTADSVQISINNGAYTKVINTSLYNTNTGIGISLQGDENYTVLNWPVVI